MDEALPDFIFAGPNKSASTWVYSALSAHPDICMAKDDPVSFFDVQYYEGMDWYQAQFDHRTDERVLGDESPGYIKSHYAPERIAEAIPDAKVIFCFRNPVDRAFSQWWHGRTRWHHSPFEFGIRDHERFDYWVVPGFYDKHLQRWERHFSPDQLLFTFFDDFVDDNASFISEIYDFVGVDASFQPPVVGEQVNEAATLAPDVMKAVPRQIRRVLRRTVPDMVIEKYLNPVYFRLRPGYRWLENLAGNRSRYEEGMDSEVRRSLEQIYEPDVRRLQKRTGKDLNHWFEYVSL